MQLLNDKVTGSTLLATEWNQPMTELQNIITDSGQTLSSGNLNQVGKGVAQYVANGNYYVDIGVADSINLVRVGSKQIIDSLVDGMLIMFKPVANNTGATTITFSTTSFPASISLYYSDGTDLSADELIVGVYSLAIYSDSLSAFVLLNPHANASIPGKITLSDSILSTSGEDDKVAATPLAVNTVLNSVIIESQSLSKINWPQISYNDANNIDFSSGRVVNKFATLAMDFSGMTKNLSLQWVAGDGNGGRASGIPYAASTWYHCFIISDDGTSGLTDAGFDIDLNAVNLLADAGWSNYKWIGAIKTSVTTDISNFVQYDDRFAPTTLDSIFASFPLSSANFLVTNNSIPPSIRVLNTINISHESSNNMATSQYLRINASHPYRS
jgi:hypothetical protein